MTWYDLSMTNIDNATARTLLFALRTDALKFALEYGAGHFEKHAMGMGSDDDDYMNAALGIASAINEELHGNDFSRMLRRLLQNGEFMLDCITADFNSIFFENETIRKILDIYAEASS